LFKVDEIVVVHEQRDGTMSSAQRRLVFERGDAVAALLYEPDTHTVVMVNQFKVPTLIARRRDNPVTADGWITEAVAGMIDPGETAEEAIIRETLEETGYRISKPELICKFFCCGPNPGLSRSPQHPEHDAWHRSGSRSFFETEIIRSLIRVCHFAARRWELAQRRRLS
jgi:nudix-type nucleoside diphosphatase (YffH/AdpP family)